MNKPGIRIQNGYLSINNCRDNNLNVVNILHDVQNELNQCVGGLEIVNCQIDMRNLIETVLDIGNITSVSLTNVPLVAKDMVYLAYLLNNQFVDELILDNNGITDLHMEMFARYLQPSRESFSFHLTNNDLSGNGAHHLANAINNGLLINSLNIRNTNIENDGGAAIFRAILYSNLSITDINIEDNNITFDGLQEIVTIVTRGIRDLEMIFIGGNDVTNEELFTIVDQLNDYIEVNFGDPVMFVAGY